MGVAAGSIVPAEPKIARVFYASTSSEPQTESVVSVLPNIVNSKNINRQNYNKTETGVPANYQRSKGV